MSSSLFSFPSLVVVVVVGGECRDMCGRGGNDKSIIVVDSAYPYFSYSSRRRLSRCTLCGMSGCMMVPVWSLVRMPSCCCCEEEAAEACWFMVMVAMAAENICSRNMTVMTATMVKRGEARGCC